MAQIGNSIDSLICLAFACVLERRSLGAGKAPGPESPAEAAFVCTFVTAVLYMQLHSVQCTLTVCASENLHSQRRCHTVQSQPGATEMQTLGPPVLQSCSGPPADFGSVSGAFLSNKLLLMKPKAKMHGMFEQ